MDKSTAILVAVISIVAILGALRGGSGPPRPVAKRFLTGREAAMLTALERALPHCRIHAQVAMGALLTVPANPLRKRTPSDRNAFSQKIVDFVAQDRASGAIIALIEVDDFTHVLARDRARDSMTGRAGYQTIRIPATTRPTFHEIRGIVEALLPSATTVGRTEVA